MPVTVNVATHAARPWSGHVASSRQDLFKQSCYQEALKSTGKGILASSFEPSSFTSATTSITSSDNGFVRAAFNAYNEHQHLIVRPDDVWFAILSQLSFYINAHAEALRDYFVSHEGKEALVVDGIEVGAMARHMAELIQEKVRDPGLKDWIMPNWSTTTLVDHTVAAVLMMGSLQAYFSYMMCIACGIPSVTLQGERADWEDMLGRLDKLPELGDEPAQFADLLRPVLRRFVQTFDDPAAPALTDFWGRITHHASGGSGPSYMSGWLTAFCFWDDKGKSLYHGRTGEGPQPPVSLERHGVTNAGCELDGVLYHRLKTSDIPCGYASVPVVLDDNGVKTSTRMLAGSVGIQVTSSGKMMDMSSPHYYSPTGEPEKTEEPRAGLDTLQSVAGWFMYEVKDEDDSNNA